MTKLQEFIILNHQDKFIYLMDLGKTKNVILPYEIDQDEKVLRFLFPTDINNEHRLQLLRKMIPLTMTIVDQDIYVELLHNLEFSLEEVKNMPKSSGIINFSISKLSDDSYNVNIYSFSEHCKHKKITDNFLSNEEIEYLNKFQTNNLKSISDSL